MLRDAGKAKGSVAVLFTRVVECFGGVQPCLSIARCAESALGGGRFLYPHRKYSSTYFAADAVLNTSGG